MTHREADFTRGFWRPECVGKPDSTHVRRRTIYRTNQAFADLSAIYMYGEQHHGAVDGLTCIKAASIGAFSVSKITQATGDMTNIEGW